MKRGDIYYADLNPTCGTEMSKKKPVAIVSNNASNKCSEVITVVPITSNITKVFPFEVYLEKNKTFLDKDSKLSCHQVRTISKRRIIGSKVGEVTPKDMQFVDNALRLHLNL